MQNNYHRVVTYPGSLLGYQARRVDFALELFLDFTTNLLAFLMDCPNERAFEFILLSETRCTYQYPIIIKNSNKYVDINLPYEQYREA